MREHCVVNLDLCYTPAVELARLIRNKELSPVDIVSNSLDRIDAVNGTLNCFCFTYHDEALERAKVAEQDVMRGKPLGALHGVPIAIKDFTPTKGKITTMGSKVYADWVPDHDAQIVKDLAGAGAIMVGKTTTPEFAHAGFCHSPLWGVTRNPWDPNRTPGGSSGGSGAAVACGCVPLAEGSDMGGSVPMTILPTVFDNISHFGPLARTIDDAALFLAAAQGPFERDIMSNPTPIDIPPVMPSDVSGLRIALDMDLGFLAIDDEIAHDVESCAQVLRDAGAVVEEVDLAWTRQCMDVWADYWCVYLAACFGQHLEDRRDDLDPTIVDYFERAKEIDAVTLKRMESVRTEQWYGLCDVFEQYDALICPTAQIPPPAAEHTDSMYEGETDDGKLKGTVTTNLFNNVAQCPALSVPAGWTSGDLPSALQIVGHRFDDLTVLRIGAAIEQRRPWAHKRPPL